MKADEAAMLAALVAILLAGGSVALLKDTAHRLIKKTQPPDAEV